MTPEDTTRLRALAEACVAAMGAREKASAAASAADNAYVRAESNDESAEETERLYGEMLIAYKAFRDAREDLDQARGLLRANVNECLILALLDEVERLRKLFDDAGQGEHNVLALVEHYQQRATEADERAALAYPRALQAAAGDYVLLTDMESYLATALRERDEARAELAMAYTRALQAAASVAVDMCETRRKHGLSGSSFERVAEDILALTPEDIASITKEHEHG